MSAYVYISAMCASVLLALCARVQLNLCSLILDHVYDLNLMMIHLR